MLKFNMLKMLGKVEELMLKKRKNYNNKDKKEKVSFNKDWLHRENKGKKEENNQKMENKVRNKKKIRLNNKNQQNKKEN